MAVILILILNFAISWFNAYQVGLAWYDSKAQGWFSQFVNACALVMSMCGFTYVYAVVMAVVARQFNWLPPEYETAIIQVCYLVIIVPVIGSGLGLTLHSILQAWRSKSLTDAGVATYNVFAQSYNTYTAFSEVGDIFSSVSGLFNRSSSSSSRSSSSSDDDGDSGAFMLFAIVLAGLAIFGGIVTTLVIASKAAENQALEVRRNLRGIRQNQKTAEV